MSAAPEVFRYRLRFGKDGPLRYTGHLDLQRTWERTLRRARVPLTYSRGHHPRPRMAFASALPLGCTSAGELLELWLDERWPAELLLQRVRAAAPPGLAVDEVEQLDPRAASLARRLMAAEYRVRVSAGPVELPQRVATLLAASTLPRERRGKRYDLRPLVEQLALAEIDGCPTLVFTLGAREGRTGRPHEVLDALGLDADRLLIHRQRLVLAEAGPTADPSTDDA